MISGYLDNSATTAVCPAAAEAALSMMTQQFGNPASLHTLGFQAEQALSGARAALASFLGTEPETLTFTSGGTEANNLAILGGASARARRGRHVITTAAEHASVAAACDELERRGFTVTRLKPRPDGMVTVRQFSEACRPDTVLISVMLVNNETGARFPVEEMVETARRQAPEALFHCDAVQAVGKIPLDLRHFPVDALSLSGHKLHAPKGSGALFLRRGVRVLPQIHGGGQERGLRAGTEAVPALVALGAAIREIPKLAEQTAHFEALGRRLTEGLATLPEVVLHRPQTAVPYIWHLSVPGLRSETMLHFLAERGVYVSSGSACSKGKKSPVLTAMGLPAAEIDSSLRVSLCRDNTVADIEALLEGLRAALSVLARRR